MTVATGIEEQIQFRYNNVGSLVYLPNYLNVDLSDVKYFQYFCT